MAGADGAMAVGNDNKAIAGGAVAVGAKNSAQGMGSLALGKYNVTKGDDSAAVGHFNKMHAGEHTHSDSKMPCGKCIPKHME